MKNLLTIIIALHVALLTLQVSAQSCLPEGITFTYQSQIDNFQANYPGCQEIEGDVIIDGNNITNLNGLNAITSFQGNLCIRNNDSLANLSGLDNLISVGGNVLIAGNPVMSNLSALDNLTYIPGDLEIGAYYNQNFHGNPSLINLAGFDNLDSIGGSLHFFLNSSLQDLTALGNLKKIDANLRVGGIWYGGNNSLTRLTGMENLVSVGGGLHVVTNTSLEDLSGLDNLTSIGGDLYIYANDSLLNLSGLSNLNAIGGSLNLGIYYYGPMGNASLIDITGLGNVLSIAGNLNILGNHVLSTCEINSICTYLTAPNGSIQIYNNAPGCNSQEEVEEACGVTGIGQLDGWTVGHEGLGVYPNPADGMVDCRWSMVDGRWSMDSLENI